MAWCGAMMYMLVNPSQDRPVNIRFRRSAETESTQAGSEVKKNHQDIQLKKVREWPEECAKKLRQFERTAFTGEFNSKNDSSEWQAFSSQYEGNFMDRYNAWHKGNAVPDLPWTSGSDWNTAYAMM